ncbi:MAG TPA: DUF6221 family protein [Micromonosporaceae bacterium]|nr:DUF6221 family protein [Micromonosporaceae bacterium]
MSAAELLAFYRARLAEDDTRARAEIAKPGMNDHNPETYNRPERMLAEVAAKRAIADAWEQREAERPQPGGDVFGYHATGLLIAIKHLATAWSDHSDYRVDWRA